ncbi:MAG: AmmeMemoRadiSam system radical SAM enzyme, partial [Planctomycetota bacterium]
TCCARCGAVLIRRDWYDILEWRLEHGACPDCGTALAGRFDARPGKFGPRRLPIRI